MAWQVLHIKDVSMQISLHILLLTSIYSYSVKHQNSSYPEQGPNYNYAGLLFLTK